MSDNMPPPPPPPNEPPVAPPPPPSETNPPGGGTQNVDWALRVQATLIDIVPILAIVIVETILGQVFLPVLWSLIGTVAAIAWWIWNYGIKQGTTGYTLGKAVIGIKLVDEAGQSVGTGMAIARGFVHIIDGIPCYLGYLWPLWDERKETFTDKVLKQGVVLGEKQDPKAFLGI